MAVEDFAKTTGGSTSKSFDSAEVQPLGTKVQKYGSAKRPPCGVTSTAQASVKKPRIYDASAPVNSKHASVKTETKAEHDDGDDDPKSQRIKKSASSANKLSSPMKATKVVSSSLKETKSKLKKKSKFSKSSKVPPSSGEGLKWTTLVHNGVIFPPPYKPHGVKMLYKGKPVDLTPEQEEVATMYAVMLDTDYMNKPQFKENFVNDWRKILGKKHVIQKLEDCDFTSIYEWYPREKEKKKQMSAEVSRWSLTVFCTWLEYRIIIVVFYLL